MFKKIFVLLVCTLLVVQVEAKDSSANSEKTLRIGLAQDFDSLNQLITSMLASTYVYNMAARKLVTLDDQMVWQPQMAEQIPSLKNKSAEIITVNGVKKIKATWKLKKNAVWGDGQPVTCEDIVFSKQVGSDKNIAVANRDAYDQVEKVECASDDNKKAVVTYATDRWDFFRMYQFYILPQHLENAVYQQYKGQKEGYEKNTLYVKDPTNPGIYNGPFLISEYKPSSHLILTKNPKFYGEAPKIDKIQIKIIPNSSSIEPAILSGDIDMVANVGYSFDLAQIFEKKVAADKLNYKVHFAQSFSYEHIDFNLDNSILKSRAVREAILMSLDRDLLVNSMFDNKQKVADHFIVPRDPWSKVIGKEVHVKHFARKEAEKILDNEGWIKNEKDGYRYKNGEKMTIVFATTSGNKMRETVAAFIQDQMKKVGIDIVMKNVPPRVFFGEVMKDRKFEGMAMYAWTFLPENPPGLFYNSKNIPNSSNGFAGRNYPGWKNELVDKSSVELETENNPAKRNGLISKIVAGYVTDHPTLPLYYRADVSIVPAKLKGYAPTGHQQTETNFVEKWSL